MTLVGANELDTAINKIGNQSDRRAHAQTIISTLCECTAPPSINIDLRIASILRLLSIDTTFVYTSLHRQHILRILRERLQQTQPRLLKTYRVDDSTQADELCRRLSPIVDDALGDLMTALGIYNGPDTLVQLRQRLLQTLNSSRCNVIVVPFLNYGNDPIELLRRCLGDVIAYVQANVHSARTTYNTALTTLSSTLSMLDTVPTTLGTPIYELLLTIREDIESHSQNNPHLQPAELDLNVNLRRHPLHEPDLDLTIPIQLINLGKGTAAEVEVKWIDAAGLQELGPPIRIRTVGPEPITIQMTARTDPSGFDDRQEALCGFGISWVNGDGSSDDTAVTKFLKPQDATVAWEPLKRSNPYSLEAVRKPSNLIGRSQILDRIISVLNTDTVGSLYIHGEKRVGKTSLAHVALRTLEQDYDMYTLFLDIGDIHNPIPSRVVDNLTSNITRRLAAYSSLSQPQDALTLDGTLVPLIAFLTSIAESRRHRGIAIALDEFDRLPHTLLQRNTESDTFFLGLRRLSSIDGIGLVLIGAERMKLVLNGPGVELNRFAPFSVDYIPRSTHWLEFKELVQAPTKGSLVFTDAAYDHIYTYTEGNPYYTKQLCSKLLEQAARRRDAFIDKSDVEAAIKYLLEDIDTTSFSHYWEDFILGDDKQRDEVTVNRRLCLLAYGLAADTRGTAAVNAVVDEAARLGLHSKDTLGVLDQFVSRKLFIRESTPSYITPRVRLFREWIMGRGQDQIIFTHEEHESARNAIETRRLYRVSIQEADDLVDQWSPYNGIRISGERLLSYLRQFDGEYGQRLIYLLLKSLTFIGAAEEASLLQGCNRVLENQLKARHDEWKREQIAISYLGQSGKSSNMMARSFARSNKFLATRHIVSPHKLIDKYSEGVTDIVVVDDFVGTGQTACNDLERLSPQLAANQVVHFFALSGMLEGLDRVEERAMKLLGAHRMHIHCPHPISNDPGPFDSRSEVFPSQEMARDARALVEYVGVQLEPRAPLGYGDCCALITFSSAIPNNAPPILWSTSSGKLSFRPLFPRH